MSKSTKTNFSLNAFLRAGMNFAGSITVDLSTGTKKWVSNTDVQVHAREVNGIAWFYKVTYKGQEVPLNEVFPEYYDEKKKKKRNGQEVNGVSYHAIPNPNPAIYGDSESITHPFDAFMHYDGGKATTGLYVKGAWETFRENNLQWDTTFKS